MSSLTSVIAGCEQRSEAKHNRGSSEAGDYNTL